LRPHGIGQITFDDKIVPPIRLVESDKQLNGESQIHINFYTVHRDSPLAKRLDAETFYNPFEVAVEASDVQHQYDTDFPIFNHKKTLVLPLDLARSSQFGARNEIFEIHVCSVKHPL
jgi:hypothetical protein